MDNFDNESQASLENLSEEELRKQFDYVEKRITNGLENHDAFDLLEAESTLVRIGAFSPRAEVADKVLKHIEEDDYHSNFDLLRLTGYLHEKRIRSVLERRYKELKHIWKEQDELRMAESYRTMLDNVARRASELSALKIKADPYLKTLDEFFERSFHDRNVERFPELAELRDELRNLRDEGGLSKDNIVTALGAARDRIGHLIEMKMAELDKRYGGKQPKPNRVIAIYYCLLEALLVQGSEVVNVNDEFIDKISQDFRAAIGHGTKRFVLNTLLKLNHPGFAEIAAEARYSLRPSTIEKAERKDEGDPEFKYQKIDLAEMQIYELYKIAAEVIGKNPVDEVFHSLLHSYNVASLLLGLRALRTADIPPAKKLTHMRTLLELGTVNEYVFIRVVDTLASIDSPGAKKLMTRLIAERYGWRKVRIPKRAFERMIDGLSASSRSGDIFEIADALIPPDRREAAEKGEDLTYPFEQTVYDRIIDKLVLRFEKNPFHGINEIAQFHLFRTLMTFVVRTPLEFAQSAKRRVLNLVRRMGQVSRARIAAMLEEVRIAFESYRAMRENVPANRRTEYAGMLTELKKTLSDLTAMRGQSAFEEKLLRDLPQQMRDYLELKRRGGDGMRFREYLGKVVSAGSAVMESRNRNIRRIAQYEHLVDRSMLSVRYPGSSRAILRGAEVLFAYFEVTGEQLARRILDSFRMEQLPKALAINNRPPDREKTESIWETLKVTLLEPLSFEQLLSTRMLIALAATGAAKHGMHDVLGELVELLYSSGQPDEARLALLQYLPIQPEFSRLWYRALGHETEAVLYVLKHELRQEQLEELKRVVPEVLDLFE